MSAIPAAASGVSVEIAPPDSRSNNGHQVDLEVGENRITVTVSENAGTASTTYTMDITREEKKESFYDICLRDYRAGLVATCGANTFAYDRVELDGRYTIDWSEWHSLHPDVTGYTIMLNEFMYKAYYDDNGEVDQSILAHVFEDCHFVGGSCEPAGGEHHSRRRHGQHAS